MPGLVLYSPALPSALLRFSFVSRSFRGASFMNVKILSLHIPPFLHLYICTFAYLHIPRLHLHIFPHPGRKNDNFMFFVMETFVV